MSNEPNPSQAGAGDEDPIGPVVLLCRPVSTIRWVSSQGMGVLGAFVAMPFIMLPFAAMWPGLGVMLLFRSEDRSMNLMWFLIGFLPAYAILIWLVYFNSRRDYFILGTNGFKLRIEFKRRTILFHDLQTISFGVKFQGPDVVGNFIAFFEPGAMSMVRHHEAAMMRLRYLDGSKAKIKSFLLRFEPEDVQAFLNYLAENHPQLLKTN